MIPVRLPCSFTFSFSCRSWKFYVTILLQVIYPAKISYFRLLTGLEGMLLLYLTGISLHFQILLVLIPLQQMNNKAIWSFTDAWHKNFRNRRLCSVRSFIRQESIEEENAVQFVVNTSLTRSLINEQGSTYESWVQVYDDLHLSRRRKGLFRGKSVTEVKQEGRKWGTVAEGSSRKRCCFYWLRYEHWMKWENEGRTYVPGLYLHGRSLRSFNTLVDMRYIIQRINVWWQCLQEDITSRPLAVTQSPENQTKVSSKWKIVIEKVRTFRVFHFTKTPWATF